MNDVLGLNNTAPLPELTQNSEPAELLDPASVLAKFTNQLKELANIVKEEVLIEGTSPIKKASVRMKLLSDMYDLLEVVRKDMNSDYDTLRLKVIPDLMVEDEVRSVVFDGVGRVQLGGDVYASIDSKSKDGAYKWLRDKGYGSLIQETVNSSTLKSFVKEYQQNMTEDKEPLPENFFKVTPFLRATIVKAGK